MMPYEMKERVPTSGDVIKSDTEGEIVEYKTGFTEFRVIKIEVNKGSKGISIKFNSFSIIVVLEGKGEVEVEDYGRFDIDLY